jgi:hypothetical protein
MLILFLSLGFAWECTGSVKDEQRFWEAKSTPCLELDVKISNQEIFLNCWNNEAKVIKLGYGGIVDWSSRYE